MSDRLIEPLDLTDFDPSQVPDNPGFTDLLSQELGIQATDLDGFSLVFDQAVALVDALGGALEGLGLTLLGAFAEADSITEAPLGELLTSFSGQLTTGAAIVASTDALLGSATPTGVAAPLCDADTVFPDVLLGPPPPGPVLFPVRIQNTHTTPLRVESVAFTRNDSSVFSEDATTPRTLVPGEVYTFNVGVKHDVAGTFHAILAAQADDQAAAHTLCLTVTVTATPAPPGGGGGGGGGGGEPCIPVKRATDVAPLCLG